MISSPGNFLNVVVLYSQERVYRFELDCNLMTAIVLGVASKGQQSVICQMIRYSQIAMDFGEKRTLFRCRICLIVFPS